jgi:hypothetical protein
VLSSSTAAWRAAGTAAASLSRSTPSVSLFSANTMGSELRRAHAPMVEAYMVRRPAPSALRCGVVVLGRKLPVSKMKMRGLRLHRSPPVPHRS